jgi:hypothetical protein
MDEWMWMPSLECVTVLVLELISLTAILHIAGDALINAVAILIIVSDFMVLLLLLQVQLIDSHYPWRD